MGFFSDLKEDLSQAVNELIPEDAEGVAEGENKEVEQVEESMSTADEPQEEAADLSAMLDKVEEMNMTYEEEEPAYTAAPVENKRVDFTSSSKAVSDETAIITSGMVINGNFTSEGSVDLKGTVSGNIEILGKLNVTGVIQGDSQAAEIFADNAKITGEVKSLGSVKIGQSSVIIGNIYATSAVIAGAVKGDIDVHGPVILDASAIVMGNIKSKSVQINNGAVIEGLCSQCYAAVNPTSFFDEFKKGKK